MKIRHKLFLINIFVIFIAIILIIFFIFSITKKVLNENIKVRAELYRNNFSNIVETVKKNLYLHIKDYALWEELGVQAVENRNKEWIEKNLDPWLRKNFNYDLILLIKDDGEVIVDTRYYKINYNYFILKDHKIDSYIVLIDNLPFICATAPVFDSSGEKFFNAYLTFGISVNETLINEWKNYLDIDFAIITEYSYISTNEEIKRMALSENKPLYQYINNYICTFLPLYDNEDNKIAEIHIHKYDDIKSRIDKTILNGIFIGSIATIITAFIINIYLIMHILKPLEKLAKATKDFTKGNYDTNLNYSKDDEIGHLTNSFKRMIDKIKYREKTILNEREVAIEMSYKDPLTNIYNRKFLIEKIEELIKKGQTFSIVFLDLDNFKVINDLLGHKAGDELLKKISSWFIDNVRKEDIVTRYGGDEFCLILNGLDKNGSNEVIERLYKHFQLQNYYPEEIPIGFSYGIASFPEDSNEIDKLLSIADKKMYQMKEAKFNK